MTILGMGTQCVANLPNLDWLKKMLTKEMSSTEKLSIINARLAISQKPSLKCDGDLTVGFFFDGTDNNKNRDYGPSVDKPKPFLKQRYSNIVALYHAFPDEKDKNDEVRFTHNSTDRCYSYYAPGVGTEFKAIDDSGEWIDHLGGSAAGYRGSVESRNARARGIKSF